MLYFKGKNFTYQKSHFLNFDTKADFRGKTPLNIKNVFSKIFLELFCQSKNALFIWFSKQFQYTVPIGN